MTGGSDIEKEGKLNFMSIQSNLKAVNKELTKHAHVPVVFNEHSRNVGILCMARQSFSIVFDRRHEVKYRCGLIIFTIIAYSFERLFSLQPRYYRIRSRARRRTMYLILSISNKC